MLYFSIKLKIVTLIFAPSKKILQVKERAVELAKAMETEDGVAGAVKAFFKHLPRKTPPSEESPPAEPTSPLMELIGPVRRCLGCSWSSCLSSQQDVSFLKEKTNITLSAIVVVSSYSCVFSRREPVRKCCCILFALYSVYLYLFFFHLKRQKIWRFRVPISFVFLRLSGLQNFFGFDFVVWAVIKTF